MITRITLFIILFYSSTGLLKAQDLIVNDKSDSLNCEILKVNGFNIYYKVRGRGEGTNWLPLTMVKSYKYNFYYQVPIENYKSEFGNSYSTNDSVYKIKKFNFSINGGYLRTMPAFNTIKNVSQLTSVNDKSGFNLSTNFSAFFLKNVGFIFDYDFSYRQEQSLLKEDYYGTTIEYDSNQKIRMHAFNVGIITRFFNKSRKHCLSIGALVGGLLYIEDWTTLIKIHNSPNFFFRGKSFGNCVISKNLLKYDYRINRLLSIGLSSAFSFGSISSIFVDYFGVYDSRTINLAHPIYTNQMVYSVNTIINF